MQTYFSYFVPLVKGNKMNDLDNHDKRIPYYELLLERDLDSTPPYSAKTPARGDSA